MKIGIFVGSFNPVHVGHIKIIQELLNKKYVDRVYIVPTMPYWNKNDLIDLNDRINMLKIVSNDEIVIDCANNKLEYTYNMTYGMPPQYRKPEAETPVSKLM